MEQLIHKIVKELNPETKVVFGSKKRIEKKLTELPSNTINTSYVERSNLNWRFACGMRI